MPLDKKKLRQYRALQKEIPMLKRKLDKLYEKTQDIPTVIGKVTKSSDDFPYIKEHLSVQMDEPKEAEELTKQIRINEQRLRKAEADRTEIEEFIVGIEDSMDRQIFELCFLKGKNQRIVADIVGLEQSSISKRITAQIQLSYNS